LIVIFGFVLRLPPIWSGSESGCIGSVRDLLIARNHFIPKPVFGQIQLFFGLIETFSDQVCNVFQSNLILWIYKIMNWERVSLKDSRNNNKLYSTNLGLTCRSFGYFLNFLVQFQLLRSCTFLWTSILNKFDRFMK